jgi:hypothetical protein
MAGVGQLLPDRDAWQTASSAPLVVVPTSAIKDEISFLPRRSAMTLIRIRASRPFRLDRYSRPAVAFDRSAERNLSPLRRVLNVRTTLDAEPQAGTRRNLGLRGVNDGDEVAHLAESRQADQQGLGRRDFLTLIDPDREWDQLDLSSDKALVRLRRQGFEDPGATAGGEGVETRPGTGSDGGDAAVEAQNTVVLFAGGWAPQIKSKHPPGYVCPKRQGRKTLSISVEPALAADVREAVAYEHSTIQDAGERLFKRYVDDYVRSTNRQPPPALASRLRLRHQTLMM